MKIVDLSQRSPEWLRWRAQGVTASEAAIVLGRSPYKTPWRLWAERTGLARAPDLSANPHVRRGNALEDEARQAFEERHGTMLLPLCGESEEHPILRASFDGIADDGSPVELKVPAERTFTEVSAKKTRGACLPALLAAGPAPALCGRCETRLVGLFRRRRAPAGVSRRARRGLSGPGTRPRLPAILGGGCEAQGAAPRSGQGPLRPDREELDQWSVLAGEYRDLLREKARMDAVLKERKADLNRVETALIAMMGGFLAAEAAGLKVTRFLQNGAVDYAKALKALLPELDPSELETYRRKASERVRVTALRRGDRHHPVRRPSGRCGLATGSQRVVLLLIIGPARAVPDRHASGADGPPENVVGCSGEDRPSTDLFVLSLSDRDRGASWALDKNSLLTNVNAGERRTSTTPWGDSLPVRGRCVSPRSRRCAP